MQVGTAQAKAAGAFPDDFLRHSGSASKISESTRQVSVSTARFVGGDRPDFGSCCRGYLHICLAVPILGT